LCGGSFRRLRHLIVSSTDYLEKSTRRPHLDCRRRLALADPRQRIHRATTQNAEIAGIDRNEPTAEFIDDAVKNSRCNFFAWLSPARDARCP